jgi:hypothetical protein
MKTRGKKVGPMKRTTNRTGLVLFLALAGIPALAQNQAPSNTQSAPSGQSLGQYARQIRKNPETAAKTPKVFDNDNLPKTDKLSVVGPAPAPAGSVTTEGAAATESTSNATAAGETKATAESKSTSGEKSAAKSTAPEDQAQKDAAIKQWNEKIDAQQQQIDIISRELDVTQREYQLRAAAMYADAGNRLRNSADWDKQDAQYKQQIADKQKALDEAKQKLEDLKDSAQKAGAQVPEAPQAQ